MKEFINLEDCMNTINTLSNVVLFFTATWCGPCKIMYPIVKDLEDKLPICHFYKIDVDEESNEDIVQYFNVSSMPTFYFIKDANIQNKLSGANKDKFSDYLKQLLTEENNIKDTELKLDTEPNTEPKLDFNNTSYKEFNITDSNLLEPDNYEPIGSNAIDLNFSIVDDF